MGLAAEADRYVWIPRRDTHDACDDMLDFATTLTEPHLRDLLEVALDGRGAFRRLKDVLAQHPCWRERWFKFRDRRLHEAVDEWLRAEGLLPETGEGATE